MFEYFPVAGEGGDTYAVLTIIWLAYVGINFYELHKDLQIDKNSFYDIISGYETNTVNYFYNFWLLVIDLVKVFSVLYLYPTLLDNYKLRESLQKKDDRKRLSFVVDICILFLQVFGILLIYLYLAELKNNTLFRLSYNVWIVHLILPLTQLDPA